MHPNQSNPLIELDCTGAFVRGTSQEGRDLQAALESVRTEVLVEDQQMLVGTTETPSEKQPLDAAFVDLPERQLDDYRNRGSTSEVGRIFASAAAMRERLDAVVLLGIGGSYMGPRALMDVLCHPYHNERSRAARGGAPRMYFAGNNLDNDAIQGLLRLLEDGAETASSRCDWGIVAVSKSGGTIETACALRVFLEALYRHSGRESQQMIERLRIVTGPRGRLRVMSQALGCEDVFDIPDGVGGRFSIFTPVGLLPAAILGIDVVRLLEGAAAMNAHFRESEAGENVVLEYVRSLYSLNGMRACDIRVLNVWSDALESVGLWHDQLLAESLGKQEKGATPLTVVNTRDLHSRAQQHQEGQRDKIHVNLVVQAARTPALQIDPSDLVDDGLDDLVGLGFPDIMAAAIEGTKQAYREDHRSTIDVKLPTLDAHVMGQLFQMLMLATVVEGRLLKINPYGQPGVEAYKRNMTQLLSRP
ncbi:MAG: glucose-6-phosphate isomerase [Planctomycetota bacterium]|nr:glucose-6-phosphate isomerase [Planctomycetota bacterium]